MRGDYGLTCASAIRASECEHHPSAARRVRHHGLAVTHASSQSSKRRDASSICYYLSTAPRLTRDRGSIAAAVGVAFLASGQQQPPLPLIIHARPADPRDASRRRPGVSSRYLLESRILAAPRVAGAASAVLVPMRGDTFAVAREPGLCAATITAAAAHRARRLDACLPACSASLDKPCRRRARRSQPSSIS